MKHPMTSTPVLVLALLLSAGATAGEQTKPTASSSGVTTEERAGVSAQGEDRKSVV